MVLVIMILTISLIILLLINVIPCIYIYINLLLSLIILYNTVYHYVYDSNKINKKCNGNTKVWNNNYRCGNFFVLSHKK